MSAAPQKKLDLWRFDAVQFPRLLCAINATQEGIDFLKVAQEMDISLLQLAELFERANDSWERTKETYA